MSGKSPIQWTEQTWNPVVGCTRVSAGCDHCYAFELHDRRHVAWKRGRWPEAPAQYHQPFSRVQLLPERLRDPLRWRKPRRVFVNSMSDLFHPDVADEFIAAVFGVMARSDQHTFQVLTKRPERMCAWMHAFAPADCMSIHYGMARTMAEAKEGAYREKWTWPLPNVWLGTSVEDQQSAAERIPHLLATPAAVRFLSCEPLLGEVDLHAHLWEDAGPEWAGRNLAEPGIDWVIVGGESGKHARTMTFASLYLILNRCKEASVPVFVKQLGSVWARCNYYVKDQHGGNPEEWPEDLRIREYPQITAKGAA